MKTFWHVYVVLNIGRSSACTVHRQAGEKKIIRMHILDATCSDERKKKEKRKESSTIFLVMRATRNEWGSTNETRRK